jgi:hypothetical protein
MLEQLQNRERPVRIVVEARPLPQFSRSQTWKVDQRDPGWDDGFLTSTQRWNSGNRSP